MTDLTNPIFTDEAKAREHLESVLWPDGPTCPHCGSMDRIAKMKGKSARPGVYYCNECKKQLTVTVGSIFERSHVPLHKWLLAFHLMAASKKGMSAHQLHRQLGITYKTAWFMAHRIREAMRSDALAPMGGKGGIVEADETFIGREPGTVIPKGGIGHKMKVLSLVDRNTGKARSIVLNDMRVDTISDIVNANVERETRLMTDEAYHYGVIGKNFSDHGSVKHKQDEYVSRADPSVHTNTIEGFFSIFKRGMKGVYQHCAKKHLHRYLAEFDFRYSHRSSLDVSDAARAKRAVAGASGKRLTYQQTNRTQVA